MSYSAKVKEELARIISKDKECQKAELSAILHTNGSLRLEGNSNFSLYVNIENPALARKVVKLLESLFKLKARILTKKNQLTKKHAFLIIVDSEPRLYQALNEIGILNDELKIEYGIVGRIKRRENRMAAFVRGAFLASGFIGNPRKKQYTLEIYFDNKRLSTDVMEILKKFALSPKAIEKKDKTVIYIKASEKIIEFLIRVGAHRTLFEFQDAKIVKSIKNKVNRVVNCETANLKKTVQAAQKQIEVINYIENNYGLHALSTALEDVAVARLKYPEYNIKELGEIFDPVLSKSAINHRLRRLNKFLKAQIN